MRWEYTTAQVMASGFEDEDGKEKYEQLLNAYGEQGWELAAVPTYQGRLVDGEVLVFLFKRPRDAAPPVE